MSRSRVREARGDDATAIAAIFREGIEDRVATFETWTPGVAETAALVESSALLLVADRQNEVVGWAKVSPYDPVNDYYSSVGEATVYVARGARGTGVGSELIEALAEAAHAAGFHKLVGKVFTTNTASVSLFATLGWTRVGVHRRHGRLDGEWKDVLVIEKLLGAAAA